MFCHLHVHNHYSYLDGFGSAKDLVLKAKSLGMTHLALTNHGNVDGCIKFQQECEKQGIIPIIGCEAYIVPDASIKDKGETRGHINLLVKNQSGWVSLCKMLTKANLDGFYHKPRIDYQDLLSANLDGLIILSACIASFVHLDPSSSFIQQLYEKTDEIYFEIMPHSYNELPQLREHHDFLLELGDSLGFTISNYVATNDVHYPSRGDWMAQEAMMAISQNKKWSDESRRRYNLKGLHLKSENEMLAAFRKQGDFPQEDYFEFINNSMIIARKCEGFRIPKQQMHLPHVKGIKDEAQEIKSLCIKRLYIEFSNNPIYVERFKEEFALITKKKFERYFVLVKDLIDTCRAKGIAVGPGRGSVGGSLIAYLMGITQVDPIEHGLLFSRFLSEDRIDWPDIDIDFSKIRRQEVLDIIRKKYGDYNTCSISTVSGMKARAALRDVGRLFDIPIGEISSITKNIWAPDKNNNDYLKEIFENSNNEEAKRFAAKYPDETLLAIKLEGQIRQPGKHAAAMIISADDLRDGQRCVLARRGDSILCNWDMSDSEYCGLIKMDILGLATLDVIKEAERLINEKGRSFYVDSEIPLDDENVFAMLSKGDTEGVFQLSGRSCTEVCRSMGVRNFEDIAAIVAIARPGPADSGVTEEYISRANGKSYQGIHPIYDDITKSTYGLVIYQEQITLILHEIAGLSHSDADKIRKVIGKKRDAKEFEPFEIQFKEGCKKKKIFSKKQADEFWEMLQEHAKYSFNKSHSVEYGLIAYWTAWLKYNWPEEFICATLSFGDFDDRSKDISKHRQSMVDFAISQGYKIMPPKVGISDATRWICHDHVLYVPFIEIKSIGEAQANDCVEFKKCKIKGFFDDPILTQRSTNKKRNEILSLICAYDKEAIPSEEILSDLLPFKIPSTSNLHGPASDSNSSGISRYPLKRKRPRKG